MKIRTDFVTNSSSSSFIVCCKEDLKINISDDDIWELGLTLGQAEAIKWTNMKERATKIQNADSLFELIKNEFFRYIDNDLEILVSDRYESLFKFYTSQLKLYGTIFYFDSVSDCDLLYDKLQDLETCILSGDLYDGEIKIESFDH